CQPTPLRPPTGLRPCRPTGSLISGWSVNSAVCTATFCTSRSRRNCCASSRTGPCPRT
ncbi:MAG: hypothetical protein AVDCRST_MAG04-2125, partial [uncultured Acetobacteraceae bacterium]